MNTTWQYVQAKLGKMMDRGPKKHNFEGEMLLTFERRLRSAGAFIKRGSTVVLTATKIPRSSFHFHSCLTQQPGQSLKIANEILSLVCLQPLTRIDPKSLPRPQKALQDLGCQPLFTPPLLTLAFSCLPTAGSWVCFSCGVPFLDSSCAWLPPSHHLKFIFPEGLSLTTLATKSDLHFYSLAHLSP